MDASRPAPASLEEALACLPDIRRPQGRRHPLLAVLKLTAVALLAGMKSLEAIAQFGRDHGEPLAFALGFPKGKTPCKATLSNLFRRLDVDALERALAGWLLARCPDLGDALAIDGKALRGSASYQVPGAHLLAAYAPRVCAVIGQVRVDGKTNEHKAALQLLGVLPLSGKVVTGDAMFCHKDVCARVLEGGGDYLWAVKDNQPTLHFDIACLFAESAAFSPYQQRRWESEQDVWTTANKGHGRRERRTLRVTPVLRDYLEWPQARQVFQVHRVRHLRGKTEEETVYGITSLGAGAAGAERLLGLSRGHWGIENRLHLVRDVTLGEDGCRVRAGSAPQLLAATRNAVVHLLEGVDAASKAAATRRFAIHPREALELVIAQN